MKDIFTPAQLKLLYHMVDVYIQGQVLTKELWEIMYPHLDFPTEVVGQEILNKISCLCEENS